MTTLRSVLGIRESDVSALRAGEQNEMMLDMQDILAQRGPPEIDSTHINEEDERIYLDAHAAEDRIRRHRDAVDTCAPSGAKLGLLQLLSSALLVILIATAFFGSHPGLWVLIAVCIFAPHKVYRVPEEHIGPLISETADAAEQEEVVTIGKKRKRRQILLELSSLVDGTDPHGTVHLAPRLLVLASAGYLAVYIFAASLFQLLLASNETIKASYSETHREWLCAISWHNQTALSNTSISFATAVNGTMSNCSWSWPSFETFGLWDASEDMPTFASYIVPSAVTLVLAGALVVLLPPRCYYSYDSPTVIGQLGSLKPLAIRLLQRGEAPPPSARPTARASAVVATCVPIFLAAAVLPGIVHAVPVLLASAYALSTTLAPPNPSFARPPAELLPMSGESGRRLCYFPAWVFRPSDDMATRIRSVVLFLLYTSCALIILAQCVWQSPMFQGWNDLHHRREGFEQRSSSWSMEDVDSATVSLWSSTMQNPWYREWGLYHVRSFLDVSDRSSSSRGSLAFDSGRVVDSPGALNSVVASADSSSFSIAVRVVVQTALYTIAVLWLRRAPASIYHVQNPAAATGPKLAPSRARDNEHRSFLFHSAAARALDKHTNQQCGMVLKVVQPGADDDSDALDTGVGALLQALVDFLSRTKKPPAESGSTGPAAERDAKDKGEASNQEMPILAKLHAALESISGWMLVVSPWVSVLCLIIAVVALPCVFAVVVTVPILVFLATGPHAVLLTARVSAVGALLLSFHLVAVIGYISAERIDGALQDAYSSSSWAWFVIIGNPYAMHLAEYGFLVASLGVSIVMLTLAFLRCIDSEVAEDLLSESRIASGVNRDKLRNLATHVKTVLPQMGMDLSVENIEGVAPEIGAVLHPFHRAVLLGTDNDQEMEAVMSEVWRFSHLISARQRVPIADWQRLMVTWSTVDRDCTTFTMRMVHDEKSLDPVLRSSCSHSLPFDVVRRKILTKVPCVRWLITEEELVLLLHILDRTLPPSPSVYVTHWHKRELFIDDVALMLAVFADGSMFLRERGRRLTEHLPWAAQMQGKASPDALRKQARSSMVHHPQQGTSPLEASVDCSDSLTDEVDRNDAWRLLRVFRAVFHESHSESSGADGGAAWAPLKPGRDSILLRGDEQSREMSDEECPYGDDNTTFAYVPAGGLSFIGSQQLVDAMHRSLGSKPSVTRVLAPEEWEPVLRWIRTCSASAIGGWRLRVIEELFRTKVQGNRTNADGSSVMTAPLTTSQRDAGAAHDDKDLPMLHARTRLSARVIAAITQFIVSVLSILWHTLAMSSFLTSMLMFWTASYRQAYNGSQTLMLIASVVLVLCSGSSSASIRHSVVIASSVVVIIALYATITGTIFRYAFASVEGYSTQSLRNATFTEVHDSVLLNMGIASVEDSPWELVMYFAALLILQVQRYVYHIDQRKDRFLKRIRSRFHQASPREPTSAALFASSAADLGSSVLHIRTTSGSIKMEDFHQPVASTDRMADSTTTNAAPKLNRASKEFAVSWAYVQQAIHWRLLSSSVFFAKLQFYVLLIVIAMLYVALVGFDTPSFVSTGLLFLYLVVAIVGSIHHKSLESAAFRVLLILIGFLCALIVAGFGIVHIPAVRYDVQASLKSDFLEHRGGNFVGSRCGFTVVQGGNATITMAFVQSDLGRWADAMADACLREIGFMKRANDNNDASTSNLQIGDSVIPYFFAVMFCAVEYWILSRFSATHRASALEGAEDNDMSTRELVQTSPIMAALHKGATFVVFLCQHNLQKALWLVNLYAAVGHISLLSLPYLAFFFFDVSGAVPIVYSAMHLVALHGYDLSFLPVFWSAQGIQLLGLPKSTALINTIVFNALNTTTNTSSYDAVVTSVWKDRASILAIGPALVLAFNLVAKNASSMIKVTAHVSNRPPQLRAPNNEAYATMPVAAPTSFVADQDSECSSTADETYAGSKKPTSMLTHLVRSFKIFCIFLYSELIRSIGAELFGLTLLVGIATNPLRVAQVAFLLHWIVAERLLGREVVRVSGIFHSVTLALFSLLLSATVFLGLRLPLEGADPTSPSALQAVHGDRSLSDAVFLGHAFFWPTDYIRAFYGVEWERYSYARYAGAQPTTALFWSYGLLICVTKLLRRDKPFHEAHPRHAYALRGRAFSSCSEAVSALQRPILMARTHLIRLFTILKPARMHSTNSPTAGGSPSSALTSLRSQGAMAFLFGKGDAALTDARVMQWEEDLVKDERRHRRQFALHERLHLAFAQHGLLLFSALKLFGLVYFPMYAIFGDANENESVLHVILTCISIRLLVATVNYETHWAPQRWIPKIVAFYQIVLMITVACNIPSVAAFIEKYSQPFRALGMTHRTSTLEENGSMSSVETTMALTAWRVVAIVVCVVQQHFQESFMYLGTLASLQDTNIDGREAHREMVAGVATIEEADKAGVIERGERRKVLLKELRATVDAAPVVSQWSPPGRTCQEASDPLELTGTDVLSGTLTGRLQDLHRRTGPLEDTIKKPSAEQPLQGSAPKTVAQRVEGWIRTLNSFTWQPTAHKAAADPLSQSRRSLRGGQGSESPRPAEATMWSRLLAALVRLLALRADFLVMALLAANFMQSGCLLDGAPLVGALVVGLTWHPWAPRFAVAAAVKMLAFNVVIKTATRFVAGQTILQPQSARLLGIFVLQMPADGSLLTLSAQGAETKSRGTSTALTDVGLDFACLAALWLYLRIGEHYGLFLVVTDVVAEADNHTDHDENDEDSASNNSDSASDVSWGTDGCDAELCDRAIQRRADEIAALERDVAEYEAALAARMEQVAAGIIADAAVDEEALDPLTLIELVRAADSRKRLPFADAAIKKNSGAEGQDRTEATKDSTDGGDWFAMARENFERKAGTGTDMYTWSALLEAVCVIYIAFGYHTLAGIDGSFASNIADNLLPGWLVLWMLLSMFVMGVDRAIYVYSATNFCLAQRLKFALHAFLSIFYVIFFVVWSATRATDASSGAGRGFFAIKLLTLWISAYQIKLGFPTFRRHDPMTVRTERSVAYSVYRAIPFLYESRMLIDWTFTQTTLTFNQYLRVEDVHHEVYNVYCDKDGAESKRGTLLPLGSKLGRGCGVFVVILLILFFPMLYYSTFNPILAKNLVTGAVLTVETDQFGSLYEATALTSPIASPENTAALDLLYPSLRQSGFLSGSADIQLLEWNACSMNRWTTTIPLRTALVNKWSSYGRATTAELNSQTVSVPQLSIKIALDSEGSIGSEDGSSTTSGSVQYSYSMSQSQALELAQAVNKTLHVSSSNVSISNGTIGASRLTNMVLPFVKNVGAAFSIQTNGHSTDLPSGGAYTCEIGLYAEIVSSPDGNEALTGDYYWCLQCQPVLSVSNDEAVEIRTGDQALASGTLPSVPADYRCLVSQRPSLCRALSYEQWDSPSSRAKPLNMPPYIVVSSQMIPSSSSLPINIGIVALYATLILSVANMLRDSMAGNATRAMLEEMHDPTPLAEMLSYLYMCRGGGDDVHLADPVLEEALFLELVDLLRAPDALRNATGLRSNTFDASGVRIPITMKRFE